MRRLLLEIVRILINRGAVIDSYFGLSLVIIRQRTNITLGLRSFLLSEIHTSTRKNEL